MKKHIQKVRTLATSTTAKDTYVLFVGNLVAAFLGFIFTVIVARGLTVEDFGVFSAANNLIMILVAITDLGVSAAIVRYIAELHGKNKHKTEKEYIKAGFIIRMVSVFVFSIALVLLAPYVGKTLTASSDLSIIYWVVAISFGMIFYTLPPFVMQAKRKFVASAVIDNGLGLLRAILTMLFYLLTYLTIDNVFLAFFLGTIASFILSVYYLGFDYLLVRTSIKKVKEILRYSGWIGVNRVVSALSGRLDVAMLAAMLGATATGLYSIPSRLTMFIMVLATSFSNVLATRLSAFGDKEREKVYLKKSVLAILGIVAGIIFWMIIAEPFVLLLFGEKYLEAVGVFRALLASTIPFMLAVPATTAIIYAMKKTIYIGTFSFFQVTAIFLLNYFLIPIYGTYAPTITFGITNTIMAIYAWIIVINYYRK